jgi:hypothetical protein
MAQFGLVFTLWHISIFYFGFGISTFLAEIVFGEIWQFLEKLRTKVDLDFCRNLKLMQSEMLDKKFFLLPTIAFLWAAASHWGVCPSKYYGDLFPLHWRIFFRPFGAY